MNKNKGKANTNIIVINKKARYDYFIEQTIESGISLHGWEVKSIRCSKVQIKESYVILKNNEIFLLGSHIAPLVSASNHIETDPVRTRKLLLKRAEINKLRDKVNQKGFTIVPLKLYWSRGNVKLEIGVAKGKKNQDKRQHIKDREWKIDKDRNIKNIN